MPNSIAGPNGQYQPYINNPQPYPPLPYTVSPPPFGNIPPSPAPSSRSAFFPGMSFNRYPPANCDLIRQYGYDLNSAINQRLHRSGVPAFQRAAAMYPSQHTDVKPVAGSPSPCHPVVVQQPYSPPPKYIPGFRPNPIIGGIVAGSLFNTALIGGMMFGHGLGIGCGALALSFLGGGLFGLC